VPGHRAERVAKALVSEADVVVLDLEDSVPPDHKSTARDTLREVSTSRPADGPALWVRCNAPDSTWGTDDLAVLAGAAVDGVRLPRCEDASTVRRVADTTGVPVQLLLESARGLLRAENLAGCHPRVYGLGLGEADLAADLRVHGDAGLEWARGWVVAVSRATGLSSPVQSVWTDVTDLDGLRASSEQGLEAGFVGRSVIHPRQISVVHEAFTPNATEVESALRVVHAAERARADGEVAVLDDRGRFIDPAVVARARVVLDLAGEHAPTPPPDQGAQR
jgi:citrate lyase subunit beta/citryl-CoA lyase